MLKSEMVCRKCIKFDQDSRTCRLGQFPMKFIIPSQMTAMEAMINVNHPQDPDIHWCSKGVWHKWSDRYKEMEPFYWGEWEETEA